MRFFSALATAIKMNNSGFRLVSAKSAVRLVENKPFFQQKGFFSKVQNNDRVLFLEKDNLILAIGSETDDRPGIDNGTVLYSTAKTFIHLKDDGSILIAAPKDVTIDGNLKVKGDVSDSIGALSSLRSKYNEHTHIGNLGAPTAITTSQDNGGVDA